MIKNIVSYCLRSKQLHILNSILYSMKPEFLSHESFVEWYEALQPIKSDLTEYNDWIGKYYELL